MWTTAKTAWPHGGLHAWGAARHEGSFVRKSVGKLYISAFTDFSVMVGPMDCRGIKVRPMRPLSVALGVPLSQPLALLPDASRSAHAAANLRVHEGNWGLVSGPFRASTPWKQPEGMPTRDAWRPFAIVSQG